MSEFAREFFQPGSMFVLQPLQLFAGEYQVQKVTIPSSPEPLQADLYLPQVREGTRRPATVMIYGITDPVADARLAKFGRMFARAGIAVLIPRFPELEQGTFTEQTVRQVEDSFLFLREQPSIDPEKVGFTSFCVGASLAIVAAENDRIRKDVAYIYAMAPYFDLRTLGPAVFSSRQKTEGSWRTWSPEQYDRTRSIFQNALLQALPAADAETIQRVLARQDNAAIDDLASLSPDGKVVERILRTRSPEELEQLFASFSKPMQERLFYLSPAGKIENLITPLFLAYGYDGYIPLSEDDAFLTADVKKFYPVQFFSFNHVTPIFDELALQEKIQETVKLWLHTWRFMAIAT